VRDFQGLAAGKKADLERRRSITSISSIWQVLPDVFQGAREISDR